MGLRSVLSGLDWNDFLLVSVDGDDAEHLVQRIYEFDSACWRDCHPGSHVDGRWMAVSGRVINPIGDEASSAKSDAQSSAIEAGPDQFVSVSLLDIDAVDDPLFWFDVCHVKSVH